LRSTAAKVWFLLFIPVHDSRQVATMNQTRQLLQCKPLGAINQLARPEDQQTLTLDSPALDALTDFSHHPAVKIDCDVLVSDLKQHMARGHARRYLVVDHNERFLGMLTGKDMEGDKYRRMASLGIPSEDIRVGDIMEASSELRAVDWAEVEKVTVRDLIASLEREHCDHLIVVDPHQGCIRGVFSAHDLAPQLHCAIEISHSPTFSDICHALTPHLR